MLSSIDMKIYNQPIEFIASKNILNIIYNVYKHIKKKSVTSTNFETSWHEEEEKEERQRSYIWTFIFLFHFVSL